MAAAGTSASAPDKSNKLDLELEGSPLDTLLAARTGVDSCFAECRGLLQDCGFEAGDAVTAEVCRLLGLSSAPGGPPKHIRAWEASRKLPELMDVLRADRAALEAELAPLLEPAPTFFVDLPEPVEVGKLSVSTSEVQKAALPDAIPARARAVKVWVGMQSGSRNADKAERWRIYTRVPATARWRETTFSEHVINHAYTANAWSSSNASFWLPVTSERCILHKRKTSTVTGNCSFTIHVTAWR